MEIKHYMLNFKKIYNVFKYTIPKLLITTFGFISLAVVISGLMYIAENGVQPEIYDNAVSGLRWMFFGHGGMYPLTIIGKLLLFCYTILRIGIVSMSIGIVIAGVVTESRKDITAMNKSFCPYCGEKIDN